MKKCEIFISGHFLFGSNMCQMIDFAEFKEFLI